MPYLKAEGNFEISAETWHFTQYLYTSVVDFEQLDEEDMAERVRRHIELYWADSFSDLTSEPAYNFRIANIEMVDEAPEELNRVQALTDYYVSGRSEGAQHKYAYSRQVLSNIQRDKWKGEYDSE